MPQPTTPTPTASWHAHRYTSYLVDLRKNWAYARRATPPGRTKHERAGSAFTYPSLVVDKIG